MERYELIKRIRKEVDDLNIFRDVVMSHEMDDVKKELLIQIILDHVSENWLVEETIGCNMIKIGDYPC